MTDCKVCAAGKLSNSSFPTKSQRASGILGIVPTDVCGLMRMESEGDARYILTFIDNCIRWCEVYFIRSKSEIAEKFMELRN